MKQLFFFFLTLLIIYSCARIGNPTGGPKDITPPKVVKSVPKNNTTYFKEKKIVITFDEYIKLKDAYKEIIVSPPLKKPPIPIVRNKSLVIDIEDELKDSMTYTMNFGKSIVDNNEENPLPDYEFIFSTGKEIDSMSVMGQVMDAFTQNPPDEKVYIMLFDNVNDSAPLKEKPTYIGRSRNKGVFMINNVKTGNYKVFALNDNNSNYIFDLYDETIGFIDSTFNLHPDIIKQEEIIIQDTILVDSIIKTSQSHLIDSIMIDSIRLPGREYALFINLRLFKEENKNQYLTSYKRQQKEKLELFFSMPLMEDCLTIDPINFSPDQNWFMKEKI